VAFRSHLDGSNHPTQTPAKRSKAERGPSLESDVKMAKDEVKEVTPETMQVQMIACNLIDADEGFNARKMDEDHPDGEGARESYKTSLRDTEDGSDAASLAASMKKNGLRQPVLARPMEDGRFALVAGFRRYTAAQALGWTHIACVVAAMDDLDAYLANLEENVQRENLSPGEIADRCLFLKEEHDMEGGDIASRLHLSKSYVNNLMRLAKELHPDIWKICRSGRNAAAPPQSKLLKWCALDTKKDQWEAYEEHMGKKSEDEDESDGDGGDGDGDPGPDKRTRATMSKLEELRDALHAAKKGSEYSEDAIKLALACVDFACGRRKNPPVKIAEEPKAKNGKKGEATADA